MPAPYKVLVTKTFERSAQKLIRKNRKMAAVLDDLLAVLENDPLNLSQKYSIRKLTSVAAGQGQWRFRSGVYRLRYDVESHTVILHSFRHRKEAY